MHTGLTQQLFQKQIVSKLISIKGSNAKGLYYGRIPISEARSKARSKIKKENPGISHKELNELTGDLNLSISERITSKKYFLKLNEESRSSGGELISELTVRDENFYDYIYVDNIRIQSPVLKSKVPKYAREEATKYEFEGNEYVFRSFTSPTEYIFTILKMLNEKGYLIISNFDENARPVGFHFDEVFLGLLNKFGFYVNAYLKQLNNNSSHRSVYAYIISRNNFNGLIYLANLDFSLSFNYDSILSTNPKEANKVSYSESTVPKDIFKRMKDGDFEYKLDVEHGPLIHDSIDGVKIFNNDRLKVQDIDKIFKVEDVSSLDSDEAVDLIRNTLSYKTSHRAGFLYLRIQLTNSKDNQLKKSVVLEALRRHPRVDAYHSCPKKLGGSNAIFIHINNEYVSPSIANFFQKPSELDDENKLSDGYFMRLEEFYGYEQLESLDKSEINIFHNYGEGYIEHSLKDLVSFNHEDDFQNFVQKVDELSRRETNTLGQIICVLRTNKDRYADKIGICVNKPEVFFKEIFNDRSDDYLFYYVNDKSVAKYIEIFLNSEVGRQLYRSNKKFKGNNKLLSPENLGNLKILMPDKNELLDTTIKANQKINDLLREVNNLNDSFMKNPRSTINENIYKLDDMLSVIGKLNDIDQVYSIIRGEEGPDREFKQTFRLPVGDIKKKEFEVMSSRISAGVMKVINSFINTNGGDLLIGVEDANHDITGLNPELNHYFGGKGRTLTEQKDKFTIEFSRKLNQAFLEKFVNENISYKFVDIKDEVCVFHITCKPSDKPCIIQETSKLLSFLNGNFFKRSGSESVPLTGQEKQDYIDEHFYNQDLDKNTL